ncbi:MAG TPA: aminotransferase class I/II-fold pyridoxal phosphate-dependent enzyme [Nitrososphaeraceae archaeon]|nr:aminotransferase class I/II-fold pyridoxal phosphate-dependent enzyme [Nitrososphaeraceae archaeon]
MKISKRISNVEYAIRDITLHARQYEKAGKKIIYLNIGDPVKYDFPTPDHIKRALLDAVSSNLNYYADSEGILELREAIVDKESQKGLSVNVEDVLVTNGISEGLDMVAASIVEPNSEILMPGPYYPPYASYVKFYGGKPIEFRITEEGAPDLDDIKSKITPKARALCIINPNNPTGEVFNSKNLKQLIDVAAEHDMYILCDEIYDKLIFDREFTGIGKVAKDAPVILLNGFSKVYLMTGWRCGYICMNSDCQKLENIRNNIPKLARVRIATNLPVQKAAVAALRGPQEYIAETVTKLKKRRDLVVKRLNEIDGISCKLPNGAFYTFPKILHNHWKDDKDFVLDLLNKTGILTVHGSGFGELGRGHFRIVYLPKEQVLEEAMDKLSDFVNGSN